MLEWLGSNYPTLIICAALAAVIALIVVKMVKDRKKGKSACGCSCTSCPMGGSCHKPAEHR